MKIQTLSIVAGTEVCNAHCPFCISSQTPTNGVSKALPDINVRNLHKACTLAQMSNVTTVLITGKGEPTLYPEQITQYLTELKDYNFPFIELQTNGIMIHNNVGKKFFYEDNSGIEWNEHHLVKWYNLGLTTIIISIVHYEDDRNREIYLPHKDKYISLKNLINILHEHGFSVRLSCVGVKGYIDSAKDVSNLIQFAKDNKVNQLTYRAVTAPEHTRNEDFTKWTKEHFVEKERLVEIHNFLKLNGHLVSKLVHGAEVYDVFGQNFCFSNCLTLDPNNEELRQLIYFPNGSLFYDWQFTGAVLL